MTFIRLSQNKMKEKNCGQFLHKIPIKSGKIWLSNKFVRVMCVSHLKMVRSYLCAIYANEPSKI